MHHRSKLPAVFSTYFEENKLLHCHDTRQKNDFHRYAVQSEIGKKTIKYRGSKLWNNLPDELKNTTSLLSFKYKLKSYLLHTLTVWIYNFSLYLIKSLTMHHVLYMFVYMSFIFARFLFVCIFFCQCMCIMFSVMGGQLRWANAFTGSLPL